MRRRRRFTGYDLVTFISVLLSLIVCLVTAGIISENITVPDALAPPTDVDVPTLQALQLASPSFSPTVTLTRTPTLTSTATNTRTATATQTPTFTQTLTPTRTSTRTATFTPSSTFTNTFTPSFTPTITLTPTSSVPTATITNTPAQFPFIVDIEKIEIRPALGDVCNFQGFGGQVFDLINEPIDGLRLVATGPGLPSEGVIGISGSNPAYGPGGWEVRVSDVLNTNQYTIQLTTVDGTPLSQPIQQTFSGICEANLMLIQFKQIRPY